MTLCFEVIHKGLISVPCSWVFLDSITKFIDKGTTGHLDNHKNAVTPKINHLISVRVLRTGAQSVDEIDDFVKCIAILVHNVKYRIYPIFRIRIHVL